MVCFRCLDERHISSEIELMKWNPKMDLIVIALNNGDIVLHRLVSWQRVWHIPAPKLKNPSNDSKNIVKTKVVDMRWRPDGKILAIAYQDNIDKNADESLRDKQSCIVLHDVESSELIHIIPFDGKVTCICWEEKRLTNKKNDSNEINFQFINKESLPPFIDLLPKVTGTNKFNRNYNSRKINEENINDLMKVENQENLNILAIGTNQGSIELVALGVFRIAKIQIGNDLSISYIALSNDLGMINILVKKQTLENQQINYSINNYQINVLKEKSLQILIISKIYAQSISLIYYLNGIICEILEAWEDVMVEIDSKLSSYGSQYKIKHENQDARDNAKIPLMADDFLELLVLGNQSAELEKFLGDLTEKGLKKLGHSIELAYSNIQKLVVKDIQRVCQLLFCHINSLKGMALWESKFSQVGLDISSVDAALKSIGSFLLKSTELQQVIDNSMRNVKAFIRWLYTAMTRHNNEPSTQSELNKVSQQDIQFVSEFIKENFDFESSSPTKALQRPTDTNFTCERVGQYFKDRKLNFVLYSVDDISSNPWIKYLKERPQLNSSDPNTSLLLYPHDFETSLIQEHKNCENTIRETFVKPFKVISSSFEISRYQSELLKVISISPDDTLKIHHTTCTSQMYIYNAFIKEQKPMNQLYLIKHSISNLNQVEIAALSFYGPQTQPTQLQFLDLEFYNEEIISLLLLDNQSMGSYLVQFPINLVQNNFQKFQNQYSQAIDVINIQLGNSNYDLTINYRSLDNMKSSILAVSGTRKVACIAFASKRRVRLFEMDVCEEDEEEFEQSKSSEQGANEMEIEVENDK